MASGWRVEIYGFAAESTAVPVVFGGGAEGSSGCGDGQGTSHLSIMRLSRQKGAPTTEQSCHGSVC